MPVRQAPVFTALVQDAPMQQNIGSFLKGFGPLGAKAAEAVGCGFVRGAVKCCMTYKF